MVSVKTINWCKLDLDVLVDCLIYYYLGKSLVFETYVSSFEIN